MKINKNNYSHQIEIKKSRKTLILEFLNKELKEEGIKKNSDSMLAEIFHAKTNIKVSRKTISKYREELKIPSSLKRE